MKSFKISFCTLDKSVLSIGNVLPFPWLSETCLIHLFWFSIEWMYVFMCLFLVLSNLIQELFRIFNAMIIQSEIMWLNFCCYSILFFFGCLIYLLHFTWVCVSVCMLMSFFISFKLYFHFYFVKYWTGYIIVVDKM